MSIDLNFEHPDSVIRLPLDDVETGATVAAQTALSRFRVPVKRPVAEELEKNFAGFAQLMKTSQVQLAFAIVPDPPAVGIVGGLMVRWFDAAGDDAVQRAIDENLEGKFLLEDPQIDRFETPLGTAIRVLHRYAQDGELLSDSKAAVATTVALEHLCWYWLLDEGLTDVVFTVTTTTSDLTRTPLLRRVTDDFAASITNV